MMFVDALGAPKDSAMENEVVEHSSRAKALMSHGALPNQTNWRPPCMKKTKDFKHGKCREQVAKTQAQVQTQAQTYFEMAKATQLKA
jgi:hypothetical protein